MKKESSSGQNRKMAGGKDLGRNSESEKLYKTVVESSLCGNFIVDDAFKFIYVNDELCRILGYTGDEIVGQDFRQFLDAESKKLVEGRYVRRQRGQKVPPRYEFNIVRKDGEKRRVEIISSVIKNDTGKVQTIVQILDVSDRRQAEKELINRTHDLDLLNSLNIVSNRGESLEKIFSLLAKKTKRIFSSYGATVYLLSPDKKTLILKNLNIPPKMKERIEKIIKMKIPEVQITLDEGSPYQEIVQNKKPRLVSSPDTIKKLMEEFTENKMIKRLIPSILGVLGIKSLINIPLYSENECFGLMDISRKEPFTKSDLERIEHISRQVSLIISHRKKDKKTRDLLTELELIFQTSKDGMRFIDKDFNVMKINDAFSSLSGFNKEEIIGKKCYESFFGTFCNTPDCPVVQARSKIVDIESEVVKKRKDGSLINCIKTVTPWKSREGRLLGIVENFKDISERKLGEQLERAMFKIATTMISTKNIADLFCAIHSIIDTLMDAKNIYIASYDDSSKMIDFPYFIDEYDEKPSQKKLGKGLTDYVIRTKKPLLATPKVFNDLLKKGKVESIGMPSIDWIGVPLVTQKGIIGVLAVQSYKKDTRYTEKEKQILLFVSTQIAMAIEQKQAEDNIQKSLEEKEILLKEIHHRVKNNMQILSSLLSLQSAKIKNKEILESFRTYKTRIKSMAIIHEKLYLSKDFAKVDFSGYIKELGTHLLQTYWLTKKNIQFITNLEVIQLDINSAIPCGLIINELISNACKYAFPEGTKGKIQVQFKLLNNGKRSLIIADNGVGLPKGINVKDPKTLGLRLVIDLVKQLDGTVIFERWKGTTVKISF